MSTTENYDSYAGLQFRNLEKSGPNIYDNDMLRLELGKRGVGSLIIPNIEAYDLESNTFLAHPTYGDDHIHLGDLHEYPIQKGSLDVVRARILTPNVLNERVPVINGPSLREIGTSKWAQYELAGDFMPKTVSIAEDQTPSPDLFDGLVGNQLVVKADMSQYSKYMKICDRTEIVNTIAGIRDEFAQYERESGKVRKNKRIDVQECVPGLPWPELRGTNEKYTQALSKAETTELRIYCFVDRERQVPFDQRYYATARVFGPGYDDWASVDQESVPAEAWGVADVVSDRLLESADAPGGYFAIDLIKGKGARDTDERIYIREINTRDAMMVESEDDKRDALMQRRLLAGAMAAMTKLGDTNTVYNGKKG